MQDKVFDIVFGGEKPIRDLSVVFIGKHSRGNIPIDRWKRVRLALLECKYYRNTTANEKLYKQLSSEVSSWGGDLEAAIQNNWQYEP